MYICGIRLSKTSRYPLLATLVATLLASVTPSALAITITASQDANVLANALLSATNTGIVVSSITLSGHQDNFNAFGTPNTVTSSGTYSNASGTYGIGPGVVLSTGGVDGLSFGGQTLVSGYGDGPNSTDSNAWAFGTTEFPPPPPDPQNPQANGIPATAAQELLLDPITGDPATQTFYDHFDVTELVINFDMQPGFDRVAFNIVFGSEEYPEFQQSDFVDGFGMFLNGVNIARVGGLPVNINHPDVMDIAGTELDGVLAPGGNPVLTFGGLVNPSANTLRFIVADTSDAIYDTTVYFSALTGVVAPVVPLPASVWLLVTAVLPVLLRLRRRRRRHTT
ncbi:MAG: choice-of-anchor L domain-containing protein [Gammaproteobacteria bacterium]